MIPLIPLILEPLELIHFPVIIKYIQKHIILINLDNELL